MIRRLFFAALVVAVLLPTQVRAVSIQSNPRNVPYVMGFHIMNSGTTPYLGQLSLSFNNGIISGTYTDISIKPGSPFANAHNLSVSGGVSGGNVHFSIRNISFKGTLNGTKMSGSATINGSIYVFEAHQGSPGSGK